MKEALWGETQEEGRILCSLCPGYCRMSEGQAGFCYITPEARPDVYRYIDAAKVDLKGFTERFYHKLTFSHLDPGLDTLKWLKNETDVWLEITNLMILDENDDPEETKRMCDWILKNLGDSVPLHFTTFHPDFKMMDKTRTPAAMLKRARQIALSAGIKFCYVSNIFDDEGQTTHCPNCHRVLIRRSWHDVLNTKSTATGVPVARQFPAILPLTAHLHREEFGARLFDNSHTSLSLAKSRKLCFIESSL